MTVPRAALRVASIVAVSALAMSACSSTMTDAEPPSSTRDSVSAPVETTTTTTEPTPTSTIEVPAGLVGSGCESYIQEVPSGPGSVLGMSADPVAVALANSPQLTTFAGALSGDLNPDVNLVETLNKGQYTVFAPTDDAFGKLDPAAIEKFKADSTELASVLKYHVVNGELDPSAVAGDLKTLQGQSLTVTASGDDLRVNNAGVACGGIKAGNATVYLLDTVLMPPPPASAMPTTSTSDEQSGDQTSTTTPTPTS